jgi:hypothetical protein
MRIKVLTGHLTDSHKKAIKAILKAGLKEGKVNNINYFIKTDSSPYTCIIKQNDRGMIPCSGSPLRLSTYTSQFIIKH